MLSKDPNLSPKDVDSILEITAVDRGAPGKDNDFGAGRVSALAAVSYISVTGLSERAVPGWPKLRAEPNPFTGRTALRIGASKSGSGPFSLRVFDAQGRLVRALAPARLPYTVWDGRDESGRPLPSGAYFAHCDAAGERSTARLILQR
jgi:hypothetical protein